MIGLPNGEGEYGLEEPVDNLRPTPCTASAGTGEEEPVFKKPMGLVFDRLTTADLKTSPERGGGGDMPN